MIFAAGCGLTSSSARDETSTPTGVLLVGASSSAARSRGLRRRRAGVRGRGSGRRWSCLLLPASFEVAQPSRDVAVERPAVSSATARRSVRRTALRGRGRERHRPGRPIAPRPDRRWRGGWRYQRGPDASEPRGRAAGHRSFAGRTRARLRRVGGKTRRTPPARGRCVRAALGRIGARKRPQCIQRATQATVTALADRVGEGRVRS